mmetsp:Transcript_8085/g.12230  ORF Transcript_8085/g.12230 Transcript_8085/m.12230 type:complete len:100 (-) Transcript_8085:101-400(-)|eukprot:CAMPEP_0201520622 /NCGR_PEP_ID=MMETSP0161_2-20130828/11996_1 /ASSEMBLY_ACC=CAM_ASM_000251 /TAXON_ID=180227 /ORGANISM="Neoparamoeba aestuarina, Strain SoJaBio B1-5/56/2" /LENGTH=99 /DNA_ID=CAMNT_0047919065 /DNA_START=101 /DNA_END=400 /DNA_ORIENTATION=+
MHITAKTLTGKEIKIEVTEGDTVSDLKNKIHELEGVIPEHQRLVSPERKLQLGKNHPQQEGEGDFENVTLGAWGIKDGDIIFFDLTSEGRILRERAMFP